MDGLQKIDHAALKSNQLMIIALNIIAFIINRPWISAAVALVMLLGTILGKPGFWIFYKYLLKPSRLIKPDILMDNPEPHRFAQGLGSVFMAAGAVALFLGNYTLGWGLVWLVTALAALNAFVGFCVGCMIYYWLSRLNFPGFNKTPPANTFPGLRPKHLSEDENLVRKHS